MFADFHTHILPGIDDGSASVEVSLAMLRMHARQGVTHVVATPHFYPQRETPQAFLRRREAALQQLQEAAARESGLPELIMGAEVFCFSGMSNSDTLYHLTIGKSEYIMIEAPPFPWPENVHRELQGIYNNLGLMPILAHVDRYIRPFQKGELFWQIAELPVIVQANADFFLRRRTAAGARKLLREGRIHLLGSDCHNLTDRRPNLEAAAQAICRHLGEDALTPVGDWGEQILRSAGAAL